jgi:hypothetical protein
VTKTRKVVPFLSIRCERRTEDIMPMEHDFDIVRRTSQSAATCNGACTLHIATVKPLRKDVRQSVPSSNVWSSGLCHCNQHLARPMCFPSSPAAGTVSSLRLFKGCFNFDAKKKGLHQTSWCSMRKPYPAESKILDY